MNWPEPTRNKHTVGGKIKVSLLRAIMCRIGIHGKHYVEVDHVGRIYKLCERCKTVIKKTS